MIFLSKVQTASTTPKPWPDAVKEEIQLYKTAKVISVLSNPLKWWKDNKHQFPHWSKLPKHYLAARATSVASERVFSGDNVTAKTAALSPENVENVDILIYLKRNLNMSKLQLSCLAIKI